MNVLKTILRLNAGSCIGFGVLFVAAPAGVAAFLGAPPAPDTVLRLLGALLILNGIHLLHTSLRAIPPKALVFYFSAADFLWVAGTAVLVAAGVWITTPAGIAAAAAVAAAVGGMGLAQVMTLHGAAPQRGSTTQ